MRGVVRWVVRNIVLLPLEEWNKARQDMRAAQAVHAATAATGAQVAIFRQALGDLEQLHREAARAIVRFPAAQELIVQMLEDRMGELRRPVEEVASGSRRAA